MGKIAQTTEEEQLSKIMKETITHKIMKIAAFQKRRTYRENAPQPQRN